MLNIPLSINKFNFVFIFLLLPFISAAQRVEDRLQKAYQQFESDEQLKHAISSLYVINAKSGEVVFDKNSQVGLAPASTQKIITAATAFELLGKDYRYKTALGFTEDKNLYVIPSGDPTLGSWRWDSTDEQKTIQRFVSAIKASGIRSYRSVVIADEKWNAESTPDGWIWQDIGNYYGAGAGGINWRENQYDVILRSGKAIGSPVEVMATKPDLYAIHFKSDLKAAAKGTGDNAYIYLPVNSSQARIRGTIPVEENSFKISGALPSPEHQFIMTLSDSLNKIKIKGEFPGKGSPKSEKTKEEIKYTELYSSVSPSLDSIIYWFLKRSINLYGEALVKTFAIEKNKIAATEEGLDILKDFWKAKGLDPDELNIRDGSGLSPLNRVTTHAQVEVLKYAKKQPWFAYYYDAFPEFNNMKMKSGTISDAKGFCGYQVSKDGSEYIFSFLVNNYSGRSSTLVNKMYKVLDVLK
jgi:serine-type D-Ala-D-Ala carboxypeptidase/endopeptidase (penicillin-binding protein 4)